MCVELCTFEFARGELILTIEKYEYTLNFLATESMSLMVMQPIESHSHYGKAAIEFRYIHQSIGEKIFKAQ